ncbi:MAG: hypothetical protein LBO72_02075 [Helicobacteraceae bacterium]|jgi:hypothetical protein|nr:hypothetical protein [Helicobacteraceae bacterium]
MLDKTKTYRRKDKGGSYLVFAIEEGGKLSEALAGEYIAIYYEEGVSRPYAQTLSRFIDEFEAIDDDDFALPLKTQNNFVECHACQ